MKKNDWIVLGVTGVYSYLFYQESIGLNLSIFTLLLIIMAIVKDKKLLKNRNWLLVSLLSLVASISLAYYGNSLSIIALIFSLLILTGMSISTKSSIIVACFNGFYSWLISGITDLRKLETRLTSDKNKIPCLKRIILIGVPIGIALLFFGLYRVSNPIFEELTNKINLEWISIYWIFFTLIGSWLTYGFFYAKFVEEIKAFDEPDSMTIQNISQKEWTLWGKSIGIIDEKFSAKVLFILLNLLILIVNLGDLNFMFFDQELPENVTYAAFLHQGVGTLIFSILVSVAIVLFYFRGEMNYIEENKIIKVLAYVWLIQNLFLLVSVGFKNFQYIDIYGLTHKRIGVYIYTLLTFIGLISTILKIYLIRKNLFLFRLNGWSFYLVLISASLVNWDQLIVNNNQSLKKEIDIHYLLSLSDTTLPSLINIEKNITNEKIREIYRKELLQKINKFRDKQEEKNWKSWSYLHENIENKLNYCQFAAE